jgi:hypothetical protein
MVCSLLRITYSIVNAHQVVIMNKNHISQVPSVRTFVTTEESCMMNT